MTKISVEVSTFVQLLCVEDFRIEGGAVHADVHRPRRHPGAREDPHGVPTD